ncbi:M56 family metallopeptidase [Mycolicibacterium cosmeticum]|uniref:M56 family metallopeptidase n=1 Tax=Mycolicibacterium cosmeticum TaxID=258533 RepID=UPI003204A5F5
MTAVLWWTIGGITVGVLTPPLLRALTRRGADAAVLLAVWAVLVCVTLTAVALPGLAELLHRCWLALHAGPPGRVDTIVGIVSAAVLGIAAIRGGWQLSRTGRQRRRLHDKHAELAWLLTGRGPQRGAVLWLPAAEPLAYSLAGDPPLVVMSTGLQQCLDRASVGAVEAHERAHVRRRHHLLIAVAQAVAAGLGWLPLMRQSPSLVRTLVELDADAHAARTHGRQGLRRALHALQSAPAPAPALGIAGDCTQLRLARLEGRRSSSGRIAGSSAAWGAALVLGMTAVLTFAALTGLASCSAG